MVIKAVMETLIRNVTHGQREVTPVSNRLMLGKTPYGDSSIASMMAVAVFWMKSSDSVSVSLSPL